MHLIEPIRECTDYIIQATGSGMKSMILDDFTTSVITTAYTRPEILLREVYIFESIELIFDSSERLNHMKCIVILRPTKDNIELLCRELNRPHYRTYHLYFTCRVGSTLVKKLSEADETEVVRCIKELPLDYQAITPFLFTLKNSGRTFDIKRNYWVPDGLKRASDGLASVLIALKINPIIRYQAQSEFCKTLAENVSKIVKGEAMTNKAWRKASPFDVNSLLVIMDRRKDLVTPIINKWNYYAMIHEQFNIVNNRISLVDVPSRQPKDPKEMLISIETDSFFDSNYYKNYGDLGSTIQEAMLSLNRQKETRNKVMSLEDMRRFIDEYPESRRYVTDLQNHLFIMTEFTRIVSEHNLIAVSECEQELACRIISRSEILKTVKQLISNPAVRHIDALRLVSLFTVCYPHKASQTELVKLLKQRGDFTIRDLDFIDQLEKFNSSKPKNPFDDTVQQVTRRIVQGVKGVENVLTQYNPSLRQIIEDLIKSNKLKEADFAFYGERYKLEPPKNLIVFVVGGVTFDEALMADQFNRSSGSEIKIVVGGSSILNFKSFMDEVRSAIHRRE